MKKKTFSDNPALQFITDDKPAAVRKTHRKSETTVNVERMREERIATLEAIRLYSLTEIEPIVGLTHRTLLSYVKSGKIKAVKIGRKWRVTEENLRSFLNGD